MALDFIIKPIHLVNEDFINTNYDWVMGKLPVE